MTEDRARRLKRCLDELLGCYDNARGGAHPKAAREFEKVFGALEKVGGEVGENKRRRTGARTWKDHTNNTMYID